MNENQPIMIQIESLSAAYENRTVLRNVNLSIYEKDFLGIIGPNGGGKTTLNIGTDQTCYGKYTVLQK